MERLSRETLVARAALQEPLPPMRRQEWWRGAAIYQVYVRSFRDANGDGIGDLRGVTEKLDYIASLNVDALWLSPFYPSPQKDFGYDISDMRNVDPRHGHLEDFATLLEEAHARDLKVMLDFVPCHTSEEHPWFVESRSSRDNDKADWYVWADAAPDGTPPNNWLSSFGGSAWTWEPRRSQYYYHPFLQCQPALDLLKPEVMDALMGEMRFWLDLGVDGMRLDAVQCLACDPDRRSNPPVGSSGPGIRIGGGPNNPFGRQEHHFDRDVPESVHVIERMRREVAAYQPERVLIGELADVDSSRLAEKYTVEGEGFHAVYDFDLINRPAEVSALVEMLHTRSAFLKTGWLMNVFSNHDSKRAVSNLTDFAVEAGKREAAAKLLLFMQFTLKGGGILFQGDELGLPHPQLEYEDLRDPWGLNLWPDFQGRDAARTLFPWSETGEFGGFTEGDEAWIRLAEEHRGLTVESQEAEPGSCLAFLRALLAWRREHPILRWGGERVRRADHAPLIVWDRYDGRDQYLCMANFSLTERFLPAGEETEGALLDVPGAAATKKPHGLELPPLGFAILRRERETPLERPTADPPLA